MHVCQCALTRAQVRELLPVLTREPGARVIAVGSNLANYARIDWHHLNALQGFAAYAQSKLCNLVHMQAVHARFNGAHRLCAACVDPGEVMMFAARCDVACDVAGGGNDVRCPLQQHHTRTLCSQLFHVCVRACVCALAY